MRDMEQIRKWKKLWGYDDLQVRPGGKMAKSDAPFRLLENMARDLDKKAETGGEDAESLREQATKLRDKAKSLKGLEYDPMDGPLAKSIEARVVNRRTVDTTALRDQIADDFYTEARGKQLNALIFGEKSKKTHYLAEGFGLRTIADRRDKTDKDKISGIRMFNDYNAAYQRGDASKKFNEDMEQLYNEDLGQHYLLTKKIEEVNTLKGSFGNELELLQKKINERDLAIKEKRYTLEQHGPKEGDKGAPEYSVNKCNKKIGSLNSRLKTLNANLSEIAEDKKLPPPEGVFFVNSSAVINKLNTLYGPDWADPDPEKDEEAIKFKPTFFNEVGPPVSGLVTVAPRILALRMDKAKMDAKQRKIFQDRLLDGTGSTPSSYDLVRAINVDTDILKDGEQDKLLDNTGALKSMAEGRGCKALANIPDGHPMAQPAQAAANMVDGLAKALAKTLPDFNKDDPLAALASAKGPLKTNKVLASCLAKIGKLTELLASYVEDAPRFARFFDLLADEVNLVLSITKPYNAEDFKAATQKINKDRIPVTQALAEDGVHCQTFMASGGMGAMSTAIQMAYEQTGAHQVFVVDGPSTHGATYFEVEANIIGKDSKAEVVEPESKDFKPPVILGTLNPSTPVTQKDHPTGWSVDELIVNIKGKLEPCAEKLTAEKPAFAIIDITVEKDGKGEDQEVNKLVSAFQDYVKAGKLVFMLNKSYQKYPALGTGKTMAGGLTIIGKGPAADNSLKGAASTQETEGQLEREENQLVTHFLTHEADIERKMLDRAAKNATFLNGLMPKVKGEPAARMAYDEGLPFLVLDDTSVTFRGNNNTDIKKREKRMQWVFHGMGLENRMSFAFQNSACLGIDEGRFRIGVGVEPKSEMVEKMYSTVRLASLGGDARSNPIGPDFLTTTSHDAIGKASEALSGMLTEGLDNDHLSEEPDLTEIEKLNKKSSEISADERRASRLEAAFTETKAEKFPEPKKLPSEATEVSDWATESAQWRHEAVELLDQHQESFDSMPFFRRYKDGSVEVDVTGYARSEKIKPLPDPMPDDFYNAAAQWTDAQIQIQLTKLKEIKGQERKSAQKELGGIDDPLGEAVKLRKAASEQRLQLAQELGVPKESVEALAVSEDGTLVLTPTVLASLEEKARREEKDNEVARDALYKKLAEKRLVAESRALTKATEDKDKDLRDQAVPKDAANNAAWREKTVRRLLKAKLLDPSKIVRGGAENIIISPSDTALKELLERAKSNPADQMKLLAAMRTTTIDNPAHNLSTVKRPKAVPPTVDVPDAGDNVWRTTLARLLTKEGLLEAYDLEKPDPKQDGILRELKAELEVRKKKAWQQTVLNGLSPDAYSKLSDPVTDEELIEAAAGQRNDWTRQAEETLKVGLSKAAFRELEEEIGRKILQNDEDAHKRAYEILGRKDDAGADVLKDKLAEYIRETLARDDTAKLAKAKQAQSALAALDPARAKSIKADMLRLALAENEDAISLRASVKKGWDADAPDPLPPEAEHLPNVVASCALMLAVAFNRKPDDKTKDLPPDNEFKQLMDPLMECGLDQVSPECKERLLVARADVAVRDIASGDDEVIKRSLAAMDQCIDEMPYLEGVSDILDSDELFAQVNAKKVNPAVLQRIADKVMGRLDIVSQMKLLSAIMEKAKKVDGAHEVGNAAAQPMIRDLAKYNDIYRDDLREKFGTEKPNDVGAEQEVRVPKRDAPRKIEGLLDVTGPDNTGGRGFPGMSFQEGLKTFGDATTLLRKLKIKNDLH